MSNKAKCRNTHSKSQLAMIWPRMPATSSTRSLYSPKAVQNKVSQVLKSKDETFELTRSGEGGVSASDLVNRL